MPFNNIGPAAGAFAPQAQTSPPRPQMGPESPTAGGPGPGAGSTDPNALLARLASMGLLGGSGAEGAGMPSPQMRGAAPETPPLPPMGVGAGQAMAQGLERGGIPGAVPTAPPRTAVQDPNDPFAQLESLMAKMPSVESLPVRPSRREKFQPGQPGAPRSGMRAHEILRNPEMVETLQRRLLTWEAENPGKTLMGSHIQQMLPEVSAAQARTIKRLLDKALNKSAAVDMDGLMQRGAAKAMTAESGEE